MSKRAGEFVTLDDLVAEIGVDAARWYLLARSHDTTVDLDLDLARSQSSENPVYYVQYAHARIASMLAKAGAERVAQAAGALGAAASEEPLHESERALIELLLAFPAELGEAVERRAPHRVDRLRAGARAGLHRLLPRLPRARGGARGAREPADRAVRGEHEHHRRMPAAARDAAHPRRCRARGGQSKRAMSESSRAASSGLSSVEAGPAPAAACLRQLGSRNASRTASPSTAAAGTR